jgi:hypothetical protein
MLPWPRHQGQTHDAEAGHLHAEPRFRSPDDPPAAPRFDDRPLMVSAFLASA